MLAATAAIEEHLKNHVLGKAEARRIKAATRDSLFAYLKTIAAAARRVTRVEPSVSPFVMPRHRSLAAELASSSACRLPPSATSRRWWIACSRRPMCA